MEHLTFTIDEHVRNYHESFVKMLLDCWLRIERAEVGHDYTLTTLLGNSWSKM